VGKRYKYQDHRESLTSQGGMNAGMGVYDPSFPLMNPNASGGKLTKAGTSQKGRMSGARKPGQVVAKQTKSSKSGGSRGKR
jgi:hypothetical protein